MFFEYSLKNFQGFMLLFSYQCPFCRSCDSLFILSHRFHLVKNFFSFSFFKFLMCSVVFATDDMLPYLFLFVNKFFKFLLLFLICRLSLARSSNVDYFTTVFILCQQLFFFFLYSLSCVLKSPDFEQQNNGEGGL